MKVYQKLLEEFRKNHGLENHLGNIFDNTMKELLEAREENFKGDVLAEVGEFSDIAVYSYNGLAQCGFNPNVNPIYRSFVSFNSACAIITDKANNMLAGGCEDSFIAIIEACASYINHLGYDFDLVMEETARKINSRKGELDPVSLKWEKLTTQDKSELYVPQYQTCKIGYLPY